MSLTCMIAGRRRVRVTDDRAGPTGKGVARSRAEPPADGDIDRARLSLNQAPKEQRHQAGPIYLAPDSRRSVPAAPVVRVSRVNELSFLPSNRPHRPSSATQLSSTRRQPNGRARAAMQRAGRTVMPAGLLPEQSSLAQATSAQWKNQANRTSGLRCLVIQDSSPQVTGPS